MRSIAVFLIRLWQWGISPWLGPHCRFEPSCSEFTRRAILDSGLARGLSRGLRRLLACHPWGKAA